RARLARPLPLAAGFAAVEAHLAALGRPSTAFAACELRSAEPFSEQGFEAFNREYVKTLARWGIYRNEANPVARTNVCPQYDKPREPVLYAFSYTVPTSSRRGSFIVAGGAEVRGGVAGYAARTVPRDPGRPRARDPHGGRQARAPLFDLRRDVCGACAAAGPGTHRLEALAPYVLRALRARERRGRLLRVQLFALGRMGHVRVH